MKFSVSLNYTLRLIFAALIVLLAFGSLRAAPALAQGSQAVTLESVQVEIWPEYDQPSVLVLYHVSLAPSVTLPAALSMRIPASAGKPYALAMQDVNGLYDLKYELTAAGEWIVVNFTTPVPDFRVEYYDPNLVKAGTQRDYAFTWPADYTTNNLVIKVQQPFAATGMTFSPSIGAGAVASDGLTYFTKLVGSVPAGTTVALDMGYENPQDALTNPQQFQPAQPVEPVDSGTSGRVTLMEGISMSVGQVAMLAAGLALIIGGSIWYWQTGARRWRTESAAPSRRRHARSSAAQAVETEGAPESVFCHHCGKRANQGDAFCRACGTKLRW